jgi:hypothetical protein
MTAETTSPQAGSPPAETRIDRLSPDALVASFSQSHLLKWFLAALAAHAIVIGGFSIGNIRDMIDPEAAAARKAAAIAAAKAASAPPAEAAAPAPAQAAAAQAGDAAKPADGSKPEGKPTGGDAAPASPIEQATSEVAKPEEIPAVPDDLGLSIEDTNPK